MKQPILKNILTLTFCLVYLNVNSQDNGKASLKCNSETIIETIEGINNISEDLMLRFLNSFIEECKHNVEFSEFWNETLFKVIQNEPELFCKVLEKNNAQIDIGSMVSELKSPLHDLIDLELTINKIADTKCNTTLKSQMILALNSAKWDEIKKIMQIQNPTLLFFQPDSIQFYSIANSEDYEFIYEVSSDFGYYASKIIELYQDSTLNVKISNNRFFIVNNELIDKFEQESPYGFIFVKENEYKIETGVFTDLEIQQMISDYFSIK